MGDMTEARELVANATLWPKVSVFLWDFAPLIHPSHLAGGKPIDPTASVRLKRYVLEAHDVKPCFHSFPADDASRLLLLDAEVFDLLAKWLGALDLAGALRRVMKGADVKALKSSLAGVYPDVFAYQPYFARFKPKAEDCSASGADLGKEAVKSGYASLYSLVSKLPEGLLHRLRLRLPADAPLPAGDVPAASPDTMDKVLLILKLKFPEAYQLCSS